METEYDDFAAEFGKFPDPSDGSKLLWESMDGDDKQEKIDRAWSLEDQRWLEAGSAGVWRQVGVYCLHRARRVRHDAELLPLALSRPVGCDIAVGPSLCGLPGRAMMMARRLQIPGHNFLPATWTTQSPSRARTPDARDAGQNPRGGISGGQ